MTASLFNNSNGSFGNVVDGFVYPQFLFDPKRAPTTNDVYPAGTRWQDNSVSPPVIYMTTGAGVWTAVSGDIKTINGTANEITASTSSQVTTLSIPSTFIAPGSIASTTTVTGGTGLVATTGGLTVNGGNIVDSHSDAGTDVKIEVTNSDNTNGASRAGVEIATGGASSGDPYLSFQISGVGASTMSMGLDNSASDLFVISNSNSLGTSNALTLSQAGALTATTSITATLGNITATNGNIVRGTAGNKDVYSSVATNGTAGANSAGTATLSGGTITINTTAVTASSIIRLYRQGVGSTGTAALGFLTTANIVANTSFDIRSVQAADATALQASDVSVVAWEIVN